MATAYYPCGEGWVEADWQDYGGTITWKCYHAYTSVVTDPTCTEQGYTTHTCSRCGDSYVDDYVEATGHSFGEWKETKAATCTEKGEKTRCCERENCNTIETQSMKALDHELSAATCTEPAKCQREGYNHTEGDALGHQWDNGVVTTEPTEEAEGVKTYTCEGCGDTKTESIPALEPTEPEEPSVPSTPVKPIWQSWLEKLFGDWWGDEEEECDHEYASVITEPTCEEKGYTTHTCTKCGDTYKDSYTDALGHQYEDGICTQCGKTEPAKPAKPNWKDILEKLLEWWK